MNKKNIFILFSVILSLFIVSCTSPSGNVTKELSGESEFVKIPLSEITTKMQKHSLNVDGTEIKYFTVLGSDGKPRTAFDACDVCGGHKGYKQVGTDVMCNQCGRYFGIDSLGTENLGGGCWPSFLEHTIEGNDVLIKKSDILTGKNKFV